MQAHLPILLPMLPIIPKIIVVNDGATDATLQIIQSFPFIQFISYIDNVGKGWALRKAFKYAVSLGLIMP